MLPKSRSAFRKELRLALALAGGTVLGVAAFASPAVAQKKGEQAKQAAPAKGQAGAFSKEFIAAYHPVVAAYKAAGPDVSAVKTQASSVVTLAKSADERHAAGTLLYQIGTKGKDPAVQRQGIAMMIDSGKVPAAELGQYNLIASQLAFNVQDYADARARAQAAIAAGNAEGDPHAILFESYFAENNNAEGFAALDKALAGRVAAGQPMDDSWIRRGFTVAYKADMRDKTRHYASMLAEHFPSKDTWGDIILIERTYSSLDDQALLDMMRLARETGALRHKRDYVDYIAVADARKLPYEVKSLLTEGAAAGLIASSDLVVKEAQTTVSARLPNDRAELATLERDARAANSKAITSMAAGDVLLGYGEAAKAEEMYQLALGKPGVDAPRALTRLGIAQTRQGKYDAAVATFGKVQGPRAPLASLWASYARQKKAGK